MMSSVALLLLLANTPPDQTTLPRHPDPDPVEQRTQRDGTPTDPWFDRAFVATDDPAFILTAVENVRQGAADAQKIGEQNEATANKLEKLAQAKGWRLPQSNPGRAATNSQASPTRANANFILNQLSFHQNTVAQYRAQIAGKGDADLKRALKDALPGYEKNRDLLLTLKP
jgi:hypothetical protein